MPKIHLKSGFPFKTGARPTPRHVLAGAEPFRRTIRAIPAECWLFPTKMSMWGNGPDPNWPDPSGDGNCVSAEEAFNKACAGVWIQDPTLYAWCNANGTLNGANLQPVIQQMQTAGFSQDSNIYGDGAPLSINYADMASLEAAIYQAAQIGSCVKFGLASEQLPSGAGNANGWFLMSDQQDSNEDHCMGTSGYGTAAGFVAAMNAAFPGLGLALPAGTDPAARGKAVYTWSTIGFAADQAFVNMTGEAWQRNPGTIISGTGTPTKVSVYSTVGPPIPPPTPPTKAYLFMPTGGTWAITPQGGDPALPATPFTSPLTVTPVTPPGVITLPAADAAGLKTVAADLAAQQTGSVTISSTDAAIITQAAADIAAQSPRPFH